MFNTFNTSCDKNQVFVIMITIAKKNLVIKHLNPQIHKILWIKKISMPRYFQIYLLYEKEDQKLHFSHFLLFRINIC